MVHRVFCLKIRIMFGVVMFAMIVVCSSGVYARQSVDPRTRFTPTKNECSVQDTQIVIQRSYVFDSVYAASPASSILSYSSSLRTEVSADLTRVRLKYIGRNSENTIRILMKYSLQVGIYPITDEENTIDIYVEHPDSLSIIAVGGTPEEPYFEMHVTLQGSSLYYKIVGDLYCPAKH